MTQENLDLFKKAVGDLQTSFAAFNEALIKCLNIVDTPDKARAPEELAPTLDRVKEVLKLLTNQPGGKDEAKRILQKHGAHKVSELVETEYAAVIDEVTECLLPF